MNRIRSSRQKKLQLEPLERRDLMALWDGAVGFMDQGPAGPPRTGGNVTAEVIDGMLVVRGDAGPNGVMIYAMGGGNYRIDSVNGWSLINGVNTRPGNDPTFSWHAPAVSGAWRGIDVDLGDGDDYVSIHGLSLPEVNIRTGDGDDAVHIDGNNDTSHFFGYATASIKVTGPASIGGNLTINTGAGVDRASAFANVTGNALIQMGAGDDTFFEPALVDRIYGTQHFVLTTGGTRTIDLGADEGEVPLPADWRDDPRLLPKLHPFILTAFEQYAADLAAGLVAPGEEWQLANPFDPTYVAVIDGDGRMKLDFTFYAGSQEVVDRLLARGLQFDAYSVDDGIAFTTLREADLRYFANLPGIGFISPRLPSWGTTFPVSWDYVREGAIPGVPPVSPPVTTPTVPPVQDPTPPTNHPDPPYLRTNRTPPTTYGPLRLEDAVYFAPTDDPTSPALSDETLSLIASYYGAQARFGPKRLEEIGPRRR